MVSVREFRVKDIEILLHPQESQAGDASRISFMSAISDIKSGPAWTIEDDGAAVVIGGFKSMDTTTGIVWALVRRGLAPRAKRVALRHALRMIALSPAMNFTKLIGYCSVKDQQGMEFLGRLGFTEMPEEAGMVGGAPVKMWVRGADAISA